MSDSAFGFFILAALLVCYVLWKVTSKKKGLDDSVAEAKGSAQGTFIGWFEEFGIAMVRGTNLVIFIVIIFGGVVAAMGAMADKNVVYAVLFVGGAFLLAGLVTGMLSMLAQVYESATISKNAQLEILKELKALNKG